MSRHFTQKELLEMASCLAGECHEHYGCLASNKRVIYGILRIVQDRTRAAAGGNENLPKRLLSKDTIKWLEKFDAVQRRTAKSKLQLP